jgi:ketosteroid isomerase-like protein
MPSRTDVEAFVAVVLSGDHVGAIREYYAPDATMQENQEPLRQGRERLVAQEQATLDRVLRVDTELLAAPLIDGDQVAIRWRFTFVRQDGSSSSLEEVAWQTWSEGKIVRETFFYDPAQMKA